MPDTQTNINQIPIKVVGGNNFGRFPKINRSETFNMLIADEALVNYAGYKAVLTLETEGSAKGRALYKSSVGKIMIAVEGGTVFSINKNLEKSIVGTLVTTTGDVFISENNNSQISISDNVHLYVYNYFENSFKTSNITPGFNIDFKPGFISFQNGRMLVASLGKANWRLSDVNNALSYPAILTGGFNAKADTVNAVLPVPGKGNLVFVFGSLNIRSYTDYGNPEFPYDVNQNFSIDFGTVNPNTIASLEEVVVWVAQNEQSGLVIKVSEGGNLREISTDGIAFKLGKLKNPENVSAFMVKLNGHLIYQVTFLDDNWSFYYDFTSGEFFTATDENLDYHPAKDVVFFENKYYFVSFRDGKLYEFGTEFFTYQYADDDIKFIPYIRILSSFRLPSQDRYIAREIGMMIESGQPNPIEKQTIYPPNAGYLLTTESGENITTESGLNLVTDQVDPANGTVVEFPTLAIDLAISYDGGENFGSNERYACNPTAHRRSRLKFYNLGSANDMTPKFHFITNQRLAVFDGLLEVYK